MAGSIPAPGVLRPRTLTNTLLHAGQQTHSHSGKPGGHMDGPATLNKR